MPLFLKNIIKDYLIKNLLGSKDISVSYSTSGEDVLLNYILANKKNGFFIDIGAYHPIKSSNTHRFYIAGWKGINIDAEKDKIEFFNEMRPRDININCMIGNKDGTADFYLLEGQDSMNSGSPEFYQKMSIDISKAQKTSVKIKKLGTILHELNIEEVIDLLTIDVEGMELDVLKSNDWEKFNPVIIMIENHCTELDRIMELETVRFLKNYKVIAFTTNEIIFLNNEYSLDLVGRVIF